MEPKDLETTEERREEKKQFGKYIGEYLRIKRLDYGISQEQLSNKAGYYRTYVGKIEQGNYSPSLHTIWRLAYALDMSLAEFFSDF